MKQVTICVPTYNTEHTLSETLNSILNQTYRNIRVKIFDNASTDGTLRVAREIAARDSRIEVFENAKNVGAEGNFDRCLAAADGDYTAIFHSDDVYEPGIVEAQVAFLESHPESVAVATQASLIDAEGTPGGRRFIPPELRDTEKAQLPFWRLYDFVVTYGNFVTCPSVMARSSVYRDQIRIWDGARFGSSADLDVWLRLAKIGSFGFLTRPLMRYRVSQASFTVRETKRRFTEHDLLRVLRAYRSTPAHDIYVQFHQAKDIAQRRLNILAAKRHDLDFPEFNGSLLRLAPLLLRSRYHFKFLTATYAIFLITGTLRLLRIHR